MQRLTTTLSTQHIQHRLRWTIFPHFLHLYFKRCDVAHFQNVGSSSSVRELAPGGLLGGRQASKHGQRLCLPGTWLGEPLITTCLPRTSQSWHIFLWKKLNLNCGYFHPLLNKATSLCCYRPSLMIPRKTRPNCRGICWLLLLLCVWISIFTGTSLPHLSRTRPSFLIKIVLTAPSTWSISHSL